ncbi:hypothetical protein B0H13DRAFT_2336222 [Mycena leptocephala]|nr:hypothetical protein B0H13DRAFT_2336222 [Mycena leptocephala]
MTGYYALTLMRPLSAVTTSACSSPQAAAGALPLLLEHIDPHSTARTAAPIFTPPVCTSPAQLGLLPGLRPALPPSYPPAPGPAAPQADTK